MRIFIIYLFMATTCFGQVNDSLLYQLKNISNDTERVNQIYKIGFDLRNSDPELAYNYALVCEQEALASKSKKHLAKSYNLLGVLFYKKGNYAKALQFQKQSLSLNQEIQNETGIAINQTNLGNIYSDINNFELAEASYLQALQAYNKTNNTLQLTRCLINIGVLKYNQKHLNAAFNQFKEALVYANQLSDYDLIASCYNNMGAILREQNKLDTALFYLEEALKMRDLIGNEIELADSYINMANVYIKQKNIAQSSHYILLADEICTKYDYTEAFVELYQTRSAFYEVQQNFEQANIWLKKYYALKDSMYKINQEIINTESLSESTIKNNIVADKKELSNQWLLVMMLVMLVGIPLYLIRYKR